MLSASVTRLPKSQLAISEFNVSISAFLYCQILWVYDRLELCFCEIETHVALWSLMCASMFSVYASIKSTLCDARIASIRVRVVFVILVDSEIRLTRALLDNMSRITWVFCIFQKSTLRSPTVIILSDFSLTLSKNHERLFQSVEFVWGGRKRQKKKYLQIGLSISSQIHSILLGSRSLRLKALN